ncbi:ABC transporter permease [Anaeromicrobium sediminis]|uniref:Ribose ABC transporter permease n=1 Tax=Anaeromicrobium sediminis TaxID=1478221 RepID=A0A267MHB7_9FIRM|nr:ABC transporter permease [Anaeromicrobium sediminis]PAB58964.1 ribose ABC transporter permease [Anaeromicrobium sediminis]
MEAITNKKSFQIKGFLRTAGTLLGLLIMCIFLSFMSPYFLTLSNALNIALQSSINAILAFGITFAIITSGIDLSVGSILALSSVSMGLAISNGIDLIPAVLLGLLIGTLAGAMNGFLITKLDLAPFIVTLGMMSIARGMSLVITKGYPISGMPKSLRILGRGKFMGMPVPVLITLIVFVIAYILLKYTKFGRYVYAIGGNEEATRLSGINVKRTKLLVYTWCGTMAGLAGIILTARLNSAQPIAGLGYELDAIAAAVIGGVSLSGGEGTAQGTLLGALIIGVLRNGLNLLNVSSFWQQVVIGCVVIGAVAIDKLQNKK